jgi:hypothetical protein
VAAACGAPARDEHDDRGRDDKRQADGDQPGEPPPLSTDANGDKRCREHTLRSTEYTPMAMPTFDPNDFPTAVMLATESALWPMARVNRTRTNSVAMPPVSALIRHTTSASTSDSATVVQRRPMRSNTRPMGRQIAAPSSVVAFIAALPKPKAWDIPTPTRPKAPQPSAWQAR